jgi:Angiotensin-converting enzyme
MARGSIVPTRAKCPSSDDLDEHMAVSRDSASLEHVWPAPTIPVLPRHVSRLWLFGTTRSLDPGQSMPWQDTLKQMTGETRVDASAMVEYFQPLIDWLKEQNKGEKTGWAVAANPLKAR